MSGCSHLSNCHHQPLHQMPRLLLLWWLSGANSSQCTDTLSFVDRFQLASCSLTRCFPTCKTAWASKRQNKKTVFSLNLGQEPSSCFLLLPHIYGGRGGRDSLPEVWYLHIKIYMLLFQRRNMVMLIATFLFSWCFDSKSTRETTQSAFFIMHNSYWKKKSSYIKNSVTSTLGFSLEITGGVSGVFKNWKKSLKIWL